MNMDILGQAVVAVFISLGAVGFVFGVYSFKYISRLNKRITELENKLNSM